MAVRSNRQILTGGQYYASKQKKKFGTEEVGFDKDSRLDYLTGFHKRKVQRQKKAQEFFQEQERLSKIEERKKVRDERKQNFESQMNEFQKKLQLQFDSDEEQPDDAEEEWTGFDSDGDNAEADKDIEDEVKPILKRKVSTELYGDSATVEIEALEPNDNFEYLARLNNVKLEKSEKILDESITRAVKYAKFLGMNEKEEEEKTKKQSKKKKKFRYLTKTERKINQMKANVNKRRK